MKEVKIPSQNQEHTMLIDDEDSWLTDILTFRIDKYGYAQTNIYANQLNLLNEKINHTIEPKYRKGTNKVHIRKPIHRIIMEIHHPELRDNPNLHVDHINGDKLDNRKENLRLVTPQQNQMNRKSNKNSTSNYKGVSWCKMGKKWRAEIMINKKTIYLGLYQDEREAALTYDRAAREYYGQYAKPNFEEETTC